jgi:hypothetical protein
VDERMKANRDDTWLRRHQAINVPIQSALENPHRNESLPMAKKKNGVNKSEEIRQLVKANSQMSVREVVSTLAGKGITVGDNLVYYVKGKMKGRQSRHKKGRQMVANVAATGDSDPVKTILKVKAWANEVGGMKKLKALVDALTE